MQQKKNPMSTADKLRERYRMAVEHFKDRSRVPLNIRRATMQMSGIQEVASDADLSWTVRQLVEKIKEIETLLVTAESIKHDDQMGGVRASARAEAGLPKHEEQPAPQPKRTRGQQEHPRAAPAAPTQTNHTPLPPRVDLSQDALMRVRHVMFEAMRQFEREQELKRLAELRANDERNHNEQRKRMREAGEVPVYYPTRDYFYRY